MRNRKFNWLHIQNSKHLRSSPIREVMKLNLKTDIVVFLENRSKEPVKSFVWMFRKMKISLYDN